MHWAGDPTQLDCIILKRSRLHGKTLAWPPSPGPGREAHNWLLGGRRHSKLPVSQGGGGVSLQLHLISTIYLPGNDSVNINFPEKQPISSAMK